MCIVLNGLNRYKRTTWALQDDSCASKQWYLIVRFTKQKVGFNVIWLKLTLAALIGYCQVNTHVGLICMSSPRFNSLLSPNGFSMSILYLVVKK